MIEYVHVMPAGRLLVHGVVDGRPAEVILPGVPEGDDETIQAVLLDALVANGRHPEKFTDDLEAAIAKQPEPELAVAIEAVVVHEGETPSIPEIVPEIVSKTRRQRIKDYLVG